jgi:hypothetical protein
LRFFFEFACDFLLMCTPGPSEFETFEAGGAGVAAAGKSGLAAEQRGRKSPMKDANIRVASERQWNWAEKNLK